MALKRAVLVGIDEYDQYPPLGGCVNDVKALAPLIQRHDDGAPNFKTQAFTSDGFRIDRRSLLGALDKLLEPGADVALFYFAGHGAQVDSDVVLVTPDGIEGDAGVPLATVLGKVQVSKVPEVLIILDCCYSGADTGVFQQGGNATVLRHGLSMLTASRGDQRAAETPNGRGMFSTFLCGALDGGAADVLGQITLAGVYDYLTESFGAFDQRPTFKANVNHLHVLRRCKPAVALAILRQLPEFFEDADKELPLDPSFESTSPAHKPENAAIFSQLQRCVAARLVEPVGAEHMYHAAMNSKACKLTPLGKHYRRLAEQGDI
jgi:hypothetical protein